jgi:hypothetical protein
MNIFLMVVLPCKNKFGGINDASSFFRNTEHTGAAPEPRSM